MIQFSFDSKGNVNIVATSAEGVSALSGWPADITLTRDDSGNYSGKVPVTKKAETNDGPDVQSGDEAGAGDAGTPAKRK
jgi:hypothetical protein